jgi:membrane-bound inhibitor of C-type lysozyme
MKSTLYAILTMIVTFILVFTFCSCGKDKETVKPNVNSTTRYWHFGTNNAPGPNPDTTVLSQNNGQYSINGIDYWCRRANVNIDYNNNTITLNQFYNDGGNNTQRIYGSGSIQGDTMYLYITNTYISTGSPLYALQPLLHKYRKV